MFGTLHSAIWSWQREIIHSGIDQEDGRNIVLSIFFREQDDCGFLLGIFPSFGSYFL